MIKAGIAGAASQRSGELIRILVNHPEVEIRTLYAPERTGESVDSVHHGLIGETDMKFSDRLDIGGLDVVFIDDCTEADSILAAIDSAGEKAPRAVDMTGRAAGREGYVCGVSELFRKSMVRGATRAYVPSAAAVVALVALYPLAANLMLSAPLAISVSAPASADLTGCGEEVAGILSSVQQSFTGGVEVTAGEPEPGRGLRLRARIASAMQPADIAALYEAIYDDHRFTFLSQLPLHIREVEGTEKCLLHISKPDPGSIEIDAIADGCLRGGAGDAVHAMNLLFALHEKTGLAFKASNF